MPFSNQGIDAALGLKKVDLPLKRLLRWLVQKISYRR